MARKQSTVRSPGSQRTPKGFTQGNILVDPNTGDPLCVKEDENGDLRLCVDTRINFEGSVGIDLTPEGDGVHIGDIANGNILVVEDDGSINVNTALDAKTGDNVAISAHPFGSQIKAKLVDELNTSNMEEIFSYTSASDNTRIRRIRCTAATSCKFVVKINGTIEEIFRTSPLQRNAVFEFDEHLALTNAQELTVEAQVDCFVGSKVPYETFVKLEGYLCT